MRRNQNKANNDKHDNSNGLIPNSFRFISSYIKTVSSNVRTAGASVSGSVSGDSSDELRKDQVLWSCFDRLELDPSTIKNVLLLGYSNGFQVLDVDDGANFSELVSSRDDPVTFLQIQPTPEEATDEGHEGFKMSHPLLLVVASEETRVSGASHNERDESQMENSMYSPRTVRFYSLRSHSYVHVLRFRSTVYMVRCSPRIVAVGLASQIYCFDAVTLENKFSVLTYPISQLGGQGVSGINIGYGPMAVGPRWLGYASNNPLLSNTGRLSPQNLSPSPGVSPSTSPGSGSLMARYAMESSKQLASGLVNLGDMSYRTFSKYCHELLPDGSSTSPSRKGGRAVTHSTESANAGMVVVKDFVSRAIISQFRAHTSPISALCFDPSGTLLVTASVHGNNINIFRILPSSSQNESGSRNFDWNSAHVHLYKLHRGMTSAVIQDICFSDYSQWVAVVSSRGTCHIFLLSPFGGETGIQLQNGGALSPFVSLPWWSTSSFTKDQSLPPAPPPPITLSVVSRIKNVNFGWINTGKAGVPPGVIAATFHSSVCRNPEPSVSSAAGILEHLLVYTPSGYVIQYELVPCLGREQGECSGSQVQASQDEELRVKVEPLQWWDVCRRTDWPEKEEFIPGRQGSVIANSDDEDGDGGSLVDKDLSKRQRQDRYLSHAEVQMRSGRLPVWQKSKIYLFYVMGPHEDEDDGGEVDIERIAVNEMEVREKDLLPVFDVVHPAWTDNRVFGAGRYSGSSSHGGSSIEKFPQDPLASHGNGSPPMEAEAEIESYPSVSVNNKDESMNSCFPPLHELMNSGSMGHGVKCLERVVSNMNMVDDGFGHDFQQDYCSNNPPCSSSTDATNQDLGDGDGRSHQRNKSEEDGDNDDDDDDMLGGVFAFSEEA